MHRVVTLAVPVLESIVIEDVPTGLGRSGAGVPAAAWVPAQAESGGVCGGGSGIIRHADTGAVSGLGPARRPCAHPPHG